VGRCRNDPGYGRGCGVANTRSPHFGSKRPGTAGEPGPSLYMGSDPQRRELIGYTSATRPSTSILTPSIVTAPQLKQKDAPHIWETYDRPLSARFAHLTLVLPEPADASRRLASPPHTTPSSARWQIDRVIDGDEVASPYSPAAAIPKAQASSGSEPPLRARSLTSDWFG
jgi:hypothetical protein